MKLKCKNVTKSKVHFSSSNSELIRESLRRGLGLDVNCVFWGDLHYCLCPKCEDLHVLTKENALLGLFLKDET